MLVKDKSKFYRKATKRGRMYFKIGGDDVPYPSVTNIISSGKEKKYKSFGASPSMVIGTIVHYRILKRYSKNLLPMSTESIWNVKRDDVNLRIARCLQMWNDLNLKIKPFAVETSLFNELPKYAGTLDLFGKINNERYILDLKTGMQYDSHVIQAGAYWNALKKKPKVMFIYLDSILDRNPEQLAIVRKFTNYELEKGYEDFLDLYIDFEI